MTKFCILTYFCMFQEGRGRLRSMAVWVQRSDQGTEAVAEDHGDEAASSGPQGLLSLLSLSFAVCQPFSLLFPVRRAMWNSTVFIHHFILCLNAVLKRCFTLFTKLHIYLSCVLSTTKSIHLIVKVCQLLLVWRLKRYVHGSMFSSHSYFSWHHWIVTEEQDCAVELLALLSDSTAFSATISMLTGLQNDANMLPLVRFCLHSYHANISCLVSSWELSFCLMCSFYFFLQSR